MIDTTITWITSLSGWLYYCFVLATLAFVLLRKRDVSEVVAWTLTIVFIPVLGPIFFVLFGHNRVARRLLRRVAHREEFEAGFSLPERVETEALIGYPEGRWGALGTLLEALGEAPRRGGNATRLYTTGMQTAEEVVRAIEAAREHIHVEFYIFRDDNLGRRFTELLLEKVRQGVQVRVIVDGIGSLRGWRLLRQIRRAGGEASSFLPLWSPSRVSPNLRNHRKIIVCDGRVAFFGGMNVGEEYLGRRGRRHREWYDLHMRVEGPAVWDLQRIFVEDWAYCTGRILDVEEIFPEIQPAGDSAVQIIAGGPDVDTNAVRQAFFGAFTRARRELYVATPYLVPDMALRDALKAAALSGVEVHLVTQAFPPDQYLVYFCGQYYAEELLEAGVHIHAYTPGMMHAKAIAVDGEWAMLGSANLDNRSMFLNFEQMAAFDGTTDVSAIAKTLKELVSDSKEIRLDEMRHRPLGQRLLASAARLFAPLL